jgi:uncharacterized phage protein (TIGR01671 family)
MKREIEFRAWTKKKEIQYNVVPFEWDYVIDTMWHKCIESNGHGILGSGGTEAKFEVGGYAIEEDDLMQFTGLKDRNGKEIYEGDILCNPNQLKGIVVYYEAGFHLEAKRKNGNIWYMPLNLGMLRNKEIIGNVYENPELINK